MFHLLFLVTLFVHVQSVPQNSSIVEYLPGFDGPLPFFLETGYIGIGKSEEVQLFYYFIKSESNPRKDPLLLWLSGGPGCSSFTGLVYEVHWILVKRHTMVAYQFLFQVHIHGPRYIGIGKAEEVQLFYYFIKSESDPRKDPLLLWLSGGPGCSSFTGLVYEVGPLNFGQKAYNGRLPILVSSPYSWTKFASILFLEQPVNTGFSYATTSEACKCTDLQACDHVYEFLRKWLINHPEFILNPFYVSGDSYSGITIPVIVQLISDGIEEGKEPLINLKGYSLGNPATFPEEDNYRIPFCHGMGLISDELYEVATRKLSTYWANDPRVQEALHVRKGTIKRPWLRCRNSIVSTSYTITFKNSIPYHVNLSSKGYRSLIYSGDHDSVVPFQSTQAWIKYLNYSVIDDWRPWTVDGQVAGYTRSFSNHMTYATVKGGGHTAPQDKDKESFHMFKRWIAQQPL